MDNRELVLLVEDIINRKEKLSEWESGFISSISEQKSFSPRQSEIINKIWDRVTGQ